MGRVVCRDLPPGLLLRQGRLVTRGPGLDLAQVDSTWDRPGPGRLDLDSTWPRSTRRGIDLAQVDSTWDRRGRRPGPALLVHELNRTHAVDEESFRLSPVSYGCQKACVELMVCDYTRKGRACRASASSKLCDCRSGASSKLCVGREVGHVVRRRSCAIDCTRK